MTDILEWLETYKWNDKVEGWTERTAINFLKLIYQTIGQTEVYGGALEIGVHHGKFFIPLHAISSPEAISVAVDIFEDQYLNIDYSGKGSLQTFKTNLETHGLYGGRNVEILSADSVLTSSAQLLDLTGGVPFKVISIDGGHTAEHTISDLNLAASVLHRFGFVIVDDILNKNWLGVIDGVTQFLRRRPTLWPLAIGYNKLIMCPMSIFPMHRKSFESNFKFEKTTQLCGYEILVA